MAKAPKLNPAQSFALVRPLADEVLGVLRKHTEPLSAQDVFRWFIKNGYPEYSYSDILWVLRVYEYMGAVDVEMGKESVPFFALKRDETAA